MVFRTVAEMFGVSISTAHTMVIRVVEFMVNRVGPSVVIFPLTEEEREEKSTAFEEVNRDH